MTCPSLRSRWVRARRFLPGEAAGVLDLEGLHNASVETLEKAAEREALVGLEAFLHTRYETPLVLQSEVH